MGQEYKNLEEIKSFVEGHDLMDNRSNIQFIANVTIKTALNEIEDEKMTVMITYEGFDNYGIVTLLNSDLNPNLFPTVFNGKWQKMEHIEGVFLQISDFHKMNPKIGQYNVKIVPIRRIKK
jgi:hypothetical protein